MDLARSNIDPAGIVELAGQSIRLQPDLFILFAGNNWGFSPSYSKPTRAELMEKLADRGYRGYVDCIETWRAHRTDLALDMLAAITARAHAGLIVVVPETNLVDWRDDLALIVPVLENDRNTQWFDLAGQAQAALGDRRYSEAAQLAARLVELDEATSPVGLAILARCRLRDGRIEEARRLFEAARDVCRALPLKMSPSCPRAIQDALRRSADKHGFLVVDLPRLIHERLEGQLPDRRMFLDYCHLTSAGIRLLTEATARAVLSMLGVQEMIDLREAAGEVGPLPSVDADAHFLAAIHCARWQESDDLVTHHCAQAMRLSPGITGRMNGYLDSFRLGGAPWLRRSFPLLIGPPRSPTYRYFCEVSPFANIEASDEALMAAIGEATRGLDPSSQGVEAATSSVLAPDHPEIDLLSPKFFAAARLNSISHSLQQKAFVEFYEPVSRFVIVLNEDKGLRLRMTYRTPAAEADQVVTIRINGAEVRVLPASRVWKSVNLGNLVMSSGRNELAFAWPRARGATKERIRRSVEQLRQGVLGNPLVEFGHCHRLRLAITPAPPARQSARAARRAGAESP